MADLESRFLTHFEFLKTNNRNSEGFVYKARFKNGESESCLKTRTVVIFTGID